MQTMKTPKKTVSVDLVEALLEAASKPRTAAQERRTTKLNEAIKANTAGYDREHDAFFDKKTGVWLEKGCGHKDCEFCKNRPKRKKL